MNKKTVNLIMWILSIFFALGAVSGLLAGKPGSWAGILLIIPAMLFNPKVGNWLSYKFKFDLNWWIRLSSVLIPIIIIGIVSPSGTTAVQNTQTTLSSNSITSSTGVASNLVSSNSEMASKSLSSTSIESSPTVAISNGNKERK